MWTMKHWLEYTSKFMWSLKVCTKPCSNQGEALSHVKLGRDV